MAGQLDVLILLRMRTGRSWIVNEDVYTRFREKELRIYTKGNCLSNSPIIIGHHLLWLDYHFVRMSQTRSLSPSHFPFPAFVYHALLSFGTFSRVVLLYPETFSFCFFTSYFLTYILCVDP